MTKEERRLLNRLVGEVATDAGCVGRETVERIAQQCGSGVTEDDVQAALTAQDVDVADLPTLPVQPPPALGAQLLANVAELRLRLSVEVVFGSALTYGFSLLNGVQVDDGRRLDQQSLDEAAAQIERLPDGRDRALRQTIIAELSEAAGAEGALDAIVLWEVILQLQDHLDGSFSQRALARQAAQLGLVRQDAEQLAAALVARCKSGQEPNAPPPKPILDHGSSTRPQRPAPAAEPVRPASQSPTPAAAPVRDLSARRFQQEVRLSWIWPGDAMAAIVAWRPAEGHDGPAGSRWCSRREYLADAGCAVVIGHTAMVFGVRAAYGDHAFGPPVEVTVSPLGVPVSYRIRPAWTYPPWVLRPWTPPPPFGPRRYVVELSAAFACELPDLVVVESRHRSQPSEPYQGNPVARIERQALAAGELIRIPVRLDRPGPSWLRCFIDLERPSADPAGIILQPPPVNQQRVR